jgi:hypothetical protein
MGFQMIKGMILTKKCSQEIREERFTSQKHLTKNVAKNWRRRNLTEFFFQMQPKHLEKKDSLDKRIVAKDRSSQNLTTILLAFSPRRPTTSTKYQQLNLPALI